MYNYKSVIFFRLALFWFFRLALVRQMSFWKREIFLKLNCPWLIDFVEEYFPSSVKRCGMIDSASHMFCFLWT